MARMNEYTYTHICTYIYIYTHICAVSQTATPVSWDMGKDAQTGVPVSRVEGVNRVLELISADTKYDLFLPIPSMRCDLFLIVLALKTITQL